MASSAFYVFSLPEKLKNSLAPFRLAASDCDDGSDASSNSDSDSDYSSGSDYDSDEEKAPESAGTKSSQFSYTHKTQYNDNYESDDHYKRRMLAHVSGHPYVYFTSPELAEDSVLAIYKCFFTKESMVQTPCETVMALETQGQSAVLMLGGGHFSGAIISHKRGNQKRNISNPLANVNVVVSKSFHRYTTRKKQGGAQSASDNAHGKANSAGSTIRRQMEAQLKMEIAALLESWKPELAKCQYIFLRAAGRTNNGILTSDADSAAIAKNDHRLRSIPFTTKRATVNEVKNVWLALTKARVLPAPAEELKPEPAVVPAQSTKPKPAATVEKSQDEIHTDAILGFIKKSETGGLVRYFNGHELDVDFKLQPEENFRSTPTALLFAAKSGKQQVVTALITAGADPTVCMNKKTTIWDLAANDKVRNALQIARKTLGENKWDWKKAKVGPAMSAAEIKARDDALKLAARLERDAKLEATEQAAKKDRFEKLVARQASAKHSAPANSGMNGLSAAEIQRVERERRARAAEARMARLGGS